MKKVTFKHINVIQSGATHSLGQSTSALMTTKLSIHVVRVKGFHDKHIFEMPHQHSITK